MPIDTRTSIEIDDPSKIRLLHDQLIICPFEPPERTASGRIIIPEMAREREREDCLRGIVVAKGPGMRTKDGGRWPMQSYEVGDEICYSTERGGTEIQINGKRHIVLVDDLVLGVVEPGEYDIKVPAKADIDPERTIQP